MGARTSSLVVLALCGCGRVGLDTSVHAGDAGLDTVDAPVDAPPDAAAGTCGATVALTDDFTAATAGAQWSVTSAAAMPIAQGGGQLFVQYATMVPASQTSNYVQLAAGDFTGGCTTAEIATIPNSGAPSAYGFVVMAGASVGVGFETQNGALLAIYYVTATSAMSVHSAAFDASAHRHVRIREHAGTYFWETSSDGVTYATFASSATTTVSPTMLRVQIGASTTGNKATNAGTATYGPVAEVLP